MIHQKTMAERRILAYRRINGLALKVSPMHYTFFNENAQLRGVATPGAQQAELQVRLSGLLFFSSARFTSFHTHASLLTFFVCFFVLFHSCYSHARVFGKTLVHEFHVSYSNIEFYFLLSDSATKEDSCIEAQERGENFTLIIKSSLFVGIFIYAKCVNFASLEIVHAKKKYSI